MSFRLRRKRHLTLTTTFITVGVSLLLLTPTLAIAAQTLQGHFAPATTPELALNFGASSAMGDGDDNTLTIDVRHCPAGTDRDLFLTELNADCPVAFPSADFILSNTRSDVSGITGEDGLVSWSGLPSDVFSVQGATPDGYDDPIVFCGLSDEPGGDVFHITQIDATDGQIQVEIETGPQDHRCYWFNVEYDRNSHVTVALHTRECPLGLAANDLDSPELSSTCNEPMEGITFTVEHADGRISADTNIAGIAILHEIPGGDLTIAESIPDGYGELLVECSIFDSYVDLWDGVVPSENGTITLGVPGHATNVVCWFANIPDPPEGDNTLNLHTFRCPHGGPFEDVGSEIPGHCTAPHDGMEFTLAHADLTDNPAIDANADGVITWAGLPTGSFTLAERLVSNYQDVLVYCEWMSAPTGVDLPSGSFAVPAPLGVFTVDFPATGMELDCGVFNLPRYASRIVINVRLCPHNADLVLTDENTIGHMAGACPTEENGIEFTLDNAHGSSTQASDGGRTRWDGVPHGVFTLTEAIPDGYREPTWYCREQVRTVDGDLEEEHGWVLFDTPGGVLSGSVDAEFGEFLECWVFNVPDPNNGSLTVIAGSPISSASSRRMVDHLSLSL